MTPILLNLVSDLEKSKLFKRTKIRKAKKEIIKQIKDTNVYRSVDLVCFSHFIKTARTLDFYNNEDFLQWENTKNVITSIDIGRWVPENSIKTPSPILYPICFTISTESSTIKADIVIRMEPLESSVDTQSWNTDRSIITICWDSNGTIYHQQLTELHNSTNIENVSIFDMLLNVFRLLIEFVFDNIERRYLRNGGE